MPYLFLGHHNDDNYETALFRLAGQARYKLGIEESPGDIPECSGLYGVHRSGAHATFQVGAEKRDVVEFEAGGVKVARPLLSFSKEDLVRLCRERELPWVEDPTNELTTLTFRNAIRSHFTPGVLPAALQKGSILDMVRRSQKALEDHKEAAERLSKMTSIHYDPYLGKLAVALPAEATIQKAMEGLESPSMLLVLSHFVRRLAEFVSPHEGVQLSQASKAATVLFDLGREKFPPNNCNAGGIIFQRSRKGGRTPADGSIWTLKRQGLSTGERKRAYEEKGAFAERLVMDVPGRDDGSGMERLAASAARKATTAKAFEPAPADFRLWDNRVWIAVCNATPHALRVEPLSKAHLSALGELMRRRRVAARHTRRRNRGWTVNTFRALGRAVGGLQPGSAADVVPVLTYVDGRDGQSRVLAFPSLELRVVRGDRARDADVPAWAADVQWAVRYRRVDCSDEELRRMLHSGGELDEFGPAKTGYKRSGKERIRPVKMFDRPAAPLYSRLTPLSKR